MYDLINYTSEWFSYLTTVPQPYASWTDFISGQVYVTQEVVLEGWTTTTQLVTNNYSYGSIYSFKRLRNALWYEPEFHVIAIASILISVILILGTLVIRYLRQQAPVIEKRGSQQQTSARDADDRDQDQATETTPNAMANENSVDNSDQLIETLDERKDFENSKLNAANETQVTAKSSFVWKSFVVLMMFLLGIVIFNLCLKVLILTGYLKSEKMVGISQMLDRIMFFDKYLNF